MKTTIERLKNKAYHTPQLERIRFDNDISLALSSPAVLPIWTESVGNFDNDLFNMPIE